MQKSSLHGHDNDVLSLACAWPESSVNLWSGCEGGIVCAWQLVNPQLGPVIKFHVGSPITALCCRGSDRIVVGTEDGSLIEYDLRSTRAPLEMLSSSALANAEVGAVAVETESNQVAAADDCGIIWKSCDDGCSTSRYEIIGKHDNISTGVDWVTLRTDDLQLLTSSLDGSLRLWSCSPDGQVGDVPEEVQYWKMGESAGGFCYSLDVSYTHALASIGSGHIAVIDLTASGVDDEENSDHGEFSLLLGHIGEAIDAQFTAWDNGKCETFLSAGNDKKLVLWDLTMLSDESGDNQSLQLSNAESRLLSKDCMRTRWKLDRKPNALVSVCHHGRPTIVVADISPSLTLIDLE